jgi:hypothetical protein
MSVGKCALCGRMRKCSPKEIEHREYDICALCWKSLETKLRGKGRAHRSRELILLPPVPAPSTEAPAKALPGHPPTIWGAWPKPKKQGVIPDSHPLGH